jgi:RNA polymerase sigma-70 factor (ECF subfamily)
MHESAVESKTEERALVARAQAGDRLAADRLLQRHRRMVVAVAYHALRNTDDAHDVAQEALVYALVHLPELREPAKFATWLRNVTLTQCADYRRRRGTRRLGEPLTILTERAEEAAFAERFAIKEAVKRLSDAHRTTLLLHYAGGWSREEVAALLGVPVNTVRSRLMAAKRHLRADLDIFDATRRKIMPVKETVALSEAQSSLIATAFPGARVVSVLTDPEPWVPFSPRVRLALADGSEKAVDFRGDIDLQKAELINTLARLGIPGPRIVHGPAARPAGNGYDTLCEVPAGENLLLWALGGTPHRLRLATERAFESIDRLQGATEALLADPVAKGLTRRTLSDEAAALTEDAKWKTDRWLNVPESDVRAWRQDPWFRDAAAKVAAAVKDISAPLVLTDYLHYFPNWVRIQPGADPFNEPSGWPGDPRYAENPIVEYVAPYGHIGDPLLGLAMVWIYDCYPFVHTGFVEQYLWRHGISRREFAPRLALQALKTMARQLPVKKPDDGSFWDAVHGWAEQGLTWM